MSISGFSQVNNGNNIDILDQQSTSGRYRPENVSKGITQSNKSEVIINNVPSYIWRHGCGPTALGMIIGFYDNNDYPDFIVGEASIQNDNVNNAIANTEHYDDYSLPIDEYPNLLQDNSELGGAHTSNCIADYMQTSWSSEENYYGWSWNNMISTAFISFVQQQYPSLNPTTSLDYFSYSSWESYKAQINNNRPVILLVDTDGNGSTDHFVTGIGYNETNSTYGIYDTWDNDIHWFQWQQMSNGSAWGIHSFTMFELGAVPSLADLEPYIPDNDDYTWDDKLIIKNTTVENGYQDMHDDVIVYGDDVYISLSYWNNSDATISNSFRIQVLIDEIEQFNIYQTEEMQAYNYWMQWNWQAITDLSIGEHTIKMIIDADNAISESDETNNEYSKTFTVHQNSNTHKFENENISIYPNPASDMIQISSSVSLDNSTIEIYTITGKLVNNFSANANIEINISNLSNGIYIIKINSETVNFVQEFVKE